MIEERRELHNLKENLDKTGCGFCAAKWTQVTIHLATGETHSCHHPAPHKIPLREIKRNPSALHNTRFKKKQRKTMLNGERPKECDYCWNIEDSSDEFSDRVYKSNEPWSKPYIEEIKNLGWRDNYNPKYVEVSFSTTCNFKCSYCGPSFSTTWMQEIKKHGAYPTSEKFNDISWFKDAEKMPIPHDESNPYLDAFWKWWPDLYRDLHTFRITGGEPLLSKDTWKVLDYIIEQENPNKELKLGINTNLGVPDSLINKLIDKIKIIEEKDLVNEIVLYTSCDTAGDQANYIRHGLDYNQFKHNLEKVLMECKKTSIVIMSTFNALSIPHYSGLLSFAYDMKKKYNNKDRYWHPSVFVDSSYLRYPKHQTVRI
jgi:organic radical activating enzyme